jgi:hypothetical protein
VAWAHARVLRAPRLLLHAASDDDHDSGDDHGADHDRHHSDHDRGDDHGRDDDYDSLISAASARAG